MNYVTLLQGKIFPSLRKCVACLAVAAVGVGFVSASATQITEAGGLIVGGKIWVADDTHAEIRNVDFRRSIPKIVITRSEVVIDGSR